MEERVLSFGKIVILKKNLAEVIVDEGVTFDEELVVEYHDFLLENLTAPFSLLINKKNAYAYTYEAQKMITNLDEINVMAVVIGSSAGLMSTETLIKINESNASKIKLFKKRNQALLWLENYTKKIVA